MARLRDRIPDPPKAWTDTHEAGDVLEGTVAERHEHEKEGELLVVLKVATGTGAIDLPCFRTDLRELGKNASQGDEIAVKFWGQNGQKFVYTFVVESGGQQPLKSADPAGPKPPVGARQDW